MAGFIKTRFQFDGIDSYAYNLSLVRGDESGLVTTPVAGGRTINQKQPARYDKPFFYFAQTEPIDATFMFMPYSGQWSTEDRSNIFKWLFGKRQYCDFLTYDDYDGDLLVFRKKYKIIFTAPLEFITANLELGYITLTAQMYPFAYTPTEIYEASSGESITIENKQNVTNWDNTFNYRPILTIEVVGNTSLSIINTTDNNRTFSITGLLVGDIITINNELMIIESADDNLIIPNFNKNWLYLIEGDNTFTITGNVTVTFTCEFPILI